jgi:hypothetical protein
MNLLLRYASKLHVGIGFCLKNLRCTPETPKII